MTLHLTDNGGGTNASPTQQFTITVTSVNDAPSFTKGADQSVVEDAGAQSVAGWATSISPGPADESAQTVSFSVTNSNNALFSVQPAVSPTGTLTYTPAANANGTLHGGASSTDNGGGTRSPTQQFTITVTAVNDAPVLAIGGSQSVAEDAGAQTIPSFATKAPGGGPDEAGQTTTYGVTNITNASLFSVQPAISPTGTLTYTPAANANGAATVTVHVTDDGGTASGGNDTSPTQQFTITVTSVNDAPTAVDDTRTVSEDSGSNAIDVLANDSTVPDTGEILTVTGVTEAAKGSVAIVGGTSVSYTPDQDANGTDSFTYTISDGNSTDTATVNVTVTSVNDAPSFTKGADQSVVEDAGAQSVTGWATSISPGPADEGAQTVSFSVTNSNNALFSVQPAVAPNGTLTYTPAANANGVATVSVRLVDSGTGANQSATQTFTITITAVNDAPSFTKGADQSVAEDAGPRTVTGWATSISPGPADEGAQTLAFDVQADNASLFSVQPAVAPNGTLTYTPAANANGVATVSVRLVDSGTGANQSATQTFTIAITAVNDAPSFTKGANQSVAEDAGAQTVPDWATGTPGPANESGQALAYVIDSITNASLFSVQPAVVSHGHPHLHPGGQRQRHLHGDPPPDRQRRRHQRQPHPAVHDHRHRRQRRADLRQGRRRRGTRGRRPPGRCRLGHGYRGRACGRGEPGAHVRRDRQHRPLPVRHAARRRRGGLAHLPTRVQPERHGDDQHRAAGQWGRRWRGCRHQRHPGLRHHRERGERHAERRQRRRERSPRPTGDARRPAQRRRRRG